MGIGSLKETEKKLETPRMMPCLHTSPHCLCLKNGLSGSTGPEHAKRNRSLQLFSEESMLIHSQSESSSAETEFYKQCLLEGSELVKKLEKNFGDLDAVSSFVQRNKETMVSLPCTGLYLRICDLNGTIYMGQKYMMEGWENLYLRDKTRMEVLGTLESTQGIVPNLQWVILVGEDGHVYAYEDEELHLIADSLKEFAQNGIKVDVESFHCPSYSSDEEEESLEQDKEIQEIRQRTRDFVEKSADDFDDFFNFLSS